MAPCTASGDAADLIPEETLACLKVNQGPDLKAVLDDPLWKKSTWIPKFCLPGSETWLPPVQSRVATLYDNECLYVAFHFEEPKMNELHALGRNWMEPIFLDDTAEIYLDPNHDHSSYAQLVANVNGAMWQQGVGLKIESGARAIGRRGEDFWDVVVAIPFAALGRETPEEGEVWGANFYRVRYAGGKPGIPATSGAWPPYGGFKNVLRYGHLLFAGSQVPAFVRARQEGKPVVLPNASPDRSKPVAVHEDHIDINLRGRVFLRLVKEGNEVKGLGDVLLGDMPLRAQSSPLIRPKVVELLEKEVRTVLYRNWEYSGWKKEGVGIVIQTVLKEENGNADNLDWVFQPRVEMINGKRYNGFAYSYRFRSGVHEVFQIMEASTWELGGSAVGKTVLSLPFEEKLSYEGSFGFSGSCRFAWNSVGFFDYQMGEEGTLLAYFEKPAVIDSGLYKPANSNVIQYFDYVCFGSGKKVETPLKNLMFSRSQGIDEWTACRDYIVGKWLAQYGIKETEPLPTLQLNWQDWELRQAVTFKQMATILPYIHERGYRRVWIGIVSTNNFELTTERGGALGGEEGLAEFCREAHRLGIRVILWNAMVHMDDNAPVLKEHPEWITRMLNGKLEHFGYPCLVATSLRTGFRDYIVEKMKELRTRTGVDGFWIDSFPIVCSSELGINYGLSDPRPELKDYLELQAELTRMGYSDFLTEGTSPFGPPSGYVGGIGTFNGQEYLAYKTAYFSILGLWEVAGDEAAELIKDNFYYRLLANKCTPNTWGVIHFGDPQVMQKLDQANNDYVKVLPWMRKRHVCEDGKGIEWSGKGDNVVFSFKPFEMIVRDGSQVWDVTSNTAVRTSSGVFTTEVAHTYWIGRRVPAAIRQVIKPVLPFEVCGALRWMKGGLAIWLQIRNNQPEDCKLRVSLDICPLWNLEKSEEEVIVPAGGEIESIYPFSVLTDWGPIAPLYENYKYFTGNGYRSYSNREEININVWSLDFMIHGRIPLDQRIVEPLVKGKKETAALESVVIPRERVRFPFIPLYAGKPISSFPPAH